MVRGMSARARRGNVVGVVAMLLLLNGCGAAFRVAPPNPMDPQAELDSLKVYLAPAIEGTHDAETDPTKRRLLRDRIVRSRVRAHDIVFHEFETALFREGVALNVALDWLTLGISGVIATTGGIGLKEALGAVSAGLIGAKASIDKNAFFDKTMPVLVSQMNASRAVARVKIEDGLTKEPAEYSLATALIDVEHYRRAGTLLGAIEAIGATAGATTKRAEEVLLELRNKEFFAKKRQDRVEQILADIDKLTATQAIALAQRLPVTLSAGAQTAVDTANPTAAVTGDATGAAAKRRLKMAAVLTDRTDDDKLNAWDAALKAQ